MRHKVLWFLGFWAAFLGNGGEYEILLQNATRLSELKTPASLTGSVLINSFFAKFAELFSQERSLTLLGIVLVLAGIIYLSIVAHGTLLNTVYNTTVKKHKVSIKESWVFTRGKFFHLLVANIIFKVIGIIIALLVSWPFFLTLAALSNLSVGSSVLIVGFVIFTPLAIIASFLIKYTILYILTRGKKPFTAMGLSVMLFKEHWLITIEIALILLGINLFVGFVTLIIILLISFPFIAATSLIIYPLALPTGYYITIIALLGLIAAPIVGSILATFQLSTWSTLFSKLTARRPLTSKIVRLATALLKR